jgi:hypothetical protein
MERKFRSTARETLPGIAPKRKIRSTARETLPGTALKREFRSTARETLPGIALKRKFRSTGRETLPVTALKRKNRSIACAHPQERPSELPDGLFLQFFTPAQYLQQFSKLYRLEAGSWS